MSSSDDHPTEREPGPGAARRADGSDPYLSDYLADEIGALDSMRHVDDDPEHEPDSGLPDDDDLEE